MKYFTTPKGPAGYTNLSKPDTKFDPDGKYKTSITLTEEQAEPLIELVNEEANELAVLDKKTKKVVMPEGLKMPFEKNDDGTYTFYFATKKKPKLFDSKGNAIRNADDLRIGGGSIIRVKGGFKAYEGFGGGVTAYLNEVQLLVLEEFGGGGWGPDEDDEDGYVADNSAPQREADDSFAGDAPADDPESDDIPF